jgi:hypothetical protein
MFRHKKLELNVPGEGTVKEVIETQHREISTLTVRSGCRKETANYLQNDDPKFQAAQCRCMQKQVTKSSQKEKDHTGSFTGILTVLKTQTEASCFLLPAVP